MNTNGTTEAVTMNENETKVRRHRGQGGFTLVELMVVVVILGIIGYITTSALGGGTNSANATAIRSTANELTRAMGFLNVNLGTGIDTSTANPLSASGEDMLDVLVKGRDAVATPYQQRFDLLNMRPLKGNITEDASGNYSLMSYGISFQPCPTGHTTKVCVQLSNVPTAVVTELALKENLTYTASAQNTNDSLRWTAASGGMHTLTMLLYP